VTDRFFGILGANEFRGSAKLYLIASPPVTNIISHCTNTDYFLQTKELGAGGSSQLKQGVSSCVRLALLHDHGGRTAREGGR
jgi:hypothetical protein